MKLLWIIGISFLFTSIYGQQDECFKRVVNQFKYRTNSITINKEQNKLLIGGENKMLVVFDLEKGKNEFEFEAHYLPVIGVEYSITDNHFYTVGDRSIKFWSLGMDKPDLIYTGTHTSITSWDKTPKEDYFVASSHGTKFLIWKKSVDEPTAEIKTTHKKKIITVAIADDHKHVATGSLDNTIEIWALDSALQTSSFEAHSRPVSCLEFIQKDNFLLSASHDGYAKLWDAKSGAYIRSFPGHAMPISSIAVHPNQMYFLTASYDKNIRLYALATGKCIKEFKYHEEPVLDVAWLKNGSGFYSCDKEGDVVEWDVPERIYVEHYFGDEIQKKLEEYTLFGPRKKGESKDDFNSRQEKVEKRRLAILEEYTEKYYQLLSSQKLDKQ